MIEVETEVISRARYDEYNAGGVIGGNRFNEPHTPARSYSAGPMRYHQDFEEHRGLNSYSVRGNRGGIAQMERRRSNENNDQRDVQDERGDKDGEDQELPLNR